MKCGECKFCKTSDDIWNGNYNNGKYNYCDLTNVSKSHTNIGMRDGVFTIANSYSIISNLEAQLLNCPLLSENEWLNKKWL